VRIKKGKVLLATPTSIEVRNRDMYIVEDPILSWAVTKAFLIVVSGFGSILGLAWAGSRKIFPN